MRTIGQQLTPPTYDRNYEERLLALCAQRRFDVESWVAMGPRFFMAGLAVMLASAPDYDRPLLLKFAEQLYSGSTRQETFERWLELSPLRPSRFLPMLAQLARHAD